MASCSNCCNFINRAANLGGDDNDDDDAVDVAPSSSCFVDDNDGDCCGLPVSSLLVFGMYRTGGNPTT